MSLYFATKVGPVVTGLVAWEERRTLSTSRFMPFAVGKEVVLSSSLRAVVASEAPVATDPSLVGAFWQVTAVF